MKRIKLTQGQFAIVDDDDYAYLSKFKWSAVKSIKGRFYALRHGPRDSNGKRVCFIMHRIIAKTPKGVLTDHENHNTLDNRKNNLRLCNKSQNAANRSSLDSHNTSGFRGVSWLKSKNRFRVRITAQGKDIGLGYFKTAREGAGAYQKANKRMFGTFGGNLTGAQ